MVREFLSERRSGWARRVTLGAQVPDVPAAAADFDAALDVRSALAELPPGQRATLVPRFYCDLNVDQSARGASTGRPRPRWAASGRLRNGQAADPAGGCAEAIA